MLANSISIGVSPAELKRIDTLRGGKNRAEHIRDNAMIYRPEEVSIEAVEDRSSNIKTSFYPIEEYIIKNKVERSGIDFGKSTKATNWHNFLRCAALMPPKAYQRKSTEMHEDLQRILNQGKVDQETVAKIVEALV